MAETNDLTNQILDILAEKAMIDRSKLSLDAKLTDLEISSLDVVEAIFALEERFDIQIPYNANATAENRLEFNTVGEVVTAVESLVRSKAA